MDAQRQTVIIAVDVVIRSGMHAMIKKVAFIGLSTMGKPMAINIAQAGFDLIVYDIREARLHDLKLDRGDEYAQRDR